MNRQRPSLWVLIRALKDEESVTARSALAATRSMPPPPRRAKYRTLDARICALKQQFHTGEKSLYEYWKGVTHLIVSYC